MLTKRQKEVLDFVKSYSKKNGYSPSLQEIQKQLKLASVSTAHFHISKLQNAGYITRLDGKARSIETNSMKILTRISLIGVIAAGGPIEAIRDPHSIEVPRNMLSTGANYYALKVAGTSMIEDGIFDGDVVVVRDQQTVDDGDKAVVYLPERDSVTLKRIYRENGKVKLVPANPKMKPFYETNVEIQGKVVGVLRKES